MPSFRHLLLIAPLLLAAVVQPAQGQVLQSFSDSNRVLLLFAPRQNDARLEQQLDLLRHHAAGFADRDLIFIQLLVQADPAQTSDVLRSLKTSDMTQAEQQALRHRFHVGPADFVIVLIGKDGGEKLTSRTPISAEKLNQTIDAMPMRQDETRRRGKQK